MSIAGIDVSYHQGSIDWNKVKASGVQFVIRVQDTVLTVPEVWHRTADLQNTTKVQKVSD